MRPLILAALLLCASGRLAQAQPASDTEASRAFAEGSQLFQKGDYVGAIEAFHRAYQLKPHFSVLCNIALSQERLGNMVAAARSYQECLDGGAGQAGSAGAVKNSLERVQGRITWVMVRSPGKGGAVYVDGQRVGRAPQRVPLNPGTHVVEVRRSGADPGRQSITTRGGEEHQLELIPTDLAGPRPQIVVVKETAPPPPRRRLHQAWFWTGVGLTVGMAALTTVFGVKTLQTRDEYVASPSRDLLDSGKSSRMLTNVFVGLTAAAASASTVVFFYTDFGRRQESRPGPAVTELMLGLRRSF